VITDVLLRISNAFSCDVSDIMEVVSNDEEK
jgi:DNA-binding Xre family transcriptional regulator